MIYRKAMILNDFLKTEQGSNLSQAYKRARNIVDSNKNTKVDEALLIEKEEKELFASILLFQKNVGTSVDVKMYLDLSTKMIPYINAFFEKVLVNADDTKLKENRINLLTMFLNTSLVD